MITDGFIEEGELASRLGMARAKLKVLRPKNAETRGHGIWWALADAEAVARVVGLTLVAEQAPEVAEEELAVVSTPGRDGYHFGNKFLLRAKRAGGEVVVVRVTDSRKFTPRLQNGQPMVFKAKKALAGNWWLMVGREPRHRGVW